MLMLFRRWWFMELKSHSCYFLSCSDCSQFLCPLTFPLTDYIDHICSRRWLFLFLWHDVPLQQDILSGMIWFDFSLCLILLITEWDHFCIKIFQINCKISPMQRFLQSWKSFFKRWIIRFCHGLKGLKWIIFLGIFYYWFYGSPPPPCWAISSCILLCLIASSSGSARIQLRFVIVF